MKIIRFGIVATVLIFSLFCSGCKKKTPAVEKEIERLEQADYENHLEVEEAEFIPEEEDSILEEDFPKFESQDNSESIWDSEGKLKIAIKDDEKLIPQQTDDFTILINASKEKVSRNFYDHNGKIAKKEEWKIESVENSKLLKTTLYDYADNSFVPASKTVITETSKTVISYNEKALPVLQKKFLLSVKDDKKLETLLSEREYFYDSEAVLIKDVEKEYTWKNSDSKKLESVFEKKYLYKKSSVKDIPASYDYYEDDIFKIRTLYSDVKGTYTSQIYFGDDYSVKTFYEGNFRTKDVYYLNGSVVRETVYEK